MFRERTIVATVITSVIMIRVNRMKRIVGIAVGNSYRP